MARKNFVVKSRIIQSQHHIKTPHETRIPHIYQEDCGYYESKYSENILKKIIKNALGEDSLRYYIKEIYEDIILSTLPKGDSWENPNENYVCLLNGHFDLDTLELKEFTYLRFIPFRIKVNYDPNVSMDEWKQFIRSLVESDVDASKLQEHFGNILANHYETKKLLYLYGPQDSGKSTLIRIMQELIGRDNYSNISLFQLGEKFTNAGIYNKKANFCADFPLSIDNRYYGHLKSFTGGDMVRLQFKHQDAFDYESKAKLFFANNKLPKIDIAKADDGFYRRWNFVEFPNSFQPDDTIFAKYTTPEMKSAIFNWMIEGYKRLKKNGWRITGEDSIEDVKSIFRGNKVYKTDVDIFLIQCCKVDMKRYVIKSELYDNYRKWCFENGFPPSDNNAFHRKVKSSSVPFILIPYQPTVDGKQVHAWKGIALK